MSAPVLSLQTLTVDPATGNVYPVAAGGNTLNLPAGSRVGGVAIGTGTGLPSMTGNTGKLLTTDGSSASWATSTALSLQTTTGTLGLGGFGNITGRIGSANLPLGTVVVKHTNGSEVAYTTVASAVTAAVSGETAIIGPGTYNESVRLKNGVNIHFQNGAQLINSTGGPAFYTDGTSGAVTCKITGQGVIQSSAIDEDSDAIKLVQNGDSVYVEAREIYGYHSAVLVNPTTGTNSIVIKADTIYSEVYDTLLGNNGSTIHATVRNIYTNSPDEDSIIEVNGTAIGTVIADRAYHKTGGVMTAASSGGATMNLRVRSFEGTVAAGGNVEFEGGITSPSTIPPILAFVPVGKTLRVRGKIVAGGSTVAVEIQTGNAGTIILDHSYLIPDSGSNTFLASNAQAVSSYGTTTTRPIGANVTISGDLSISGAIPASYLGSGGAQAYDADLTSWAAIPRGAGFDAAAAIAPLANGGFLKEGSAIGATTPAAGTFTTLVAGSTTSLLLGTAGSAVGNIGFRNATSGTATLAPPTGALGTYTVTLPNAASTIPIASQQITWAGPTAARTYTLPDAAATLARTDAANTFTGASTATSWVFTTPVLGTPTSGTLTNCTSIPAGQLTGSVADARLSANVPLINATNTFTSAQTISASPGDNKLFKVVNPGDTVYFVLDGVASTVAGLEFYKSGVRKFSLRCNSSDAFYFLDNDGNPALTIAATGQAISLGGPLSVTGASTFTGGIVGTTAAGNAAAGNVGEQISASVVQGSATALTTATPKTVTSISLTAGDWDVTAVGCSTGASTGTVFDVAISANNNSFTGTVLGDSRCQTPTVSLTGADASLMIPQFRVNISATTTYYLVVSETFTIGSPAAYGRISARRRR